MLNSSSWCTVQPVELTRVFCGRWRAGELIRTVPPEVLPQLRAKVAAMELLKGHRADIGLQRAWDGNYIALVSASEAIDAVPGA